VTLLGFGKLFSLLLSQYLQTSKCKTPNIIQQHTVPGNGHNMFHILHTHMHSC